MPKRVQLSRRKGWRKPPETIAVSRPSRWGNPYHIMADRSPAEAVRLYRVSVLSHWGEEYRQLAKDALRGKNLACWCSLDSPCHADVLLEIANEKGPFDARQP